MWGKLADKINKRLNEDEEEITFKSYDEESDRVGGALNPASEVKADGKEKDSSIKFKVMKPESFDDVSVLLLTDCGELNIEGKDLRIGVLDTEKGVVSIDGSVDAVYYSEDSQKRRGSLFGKRQK